MLVVIAPLSFTSPDSVIGSENRVDLRLEIDVSAADPGADQSDVAITKRAIVEWHEQREGTPLKRFRMIFSLKACNCLFKADVPWNLFKKRGNSHRSFVTREISTL